MSKPTLPEALHLLNLANQKKELTSERLGSLFRSGLLSDLFEAEVSNIDRKKFRKFLGLMPLEFRIIVDYGKTLEQMIFAGDYGRKSADIISKYFPIIGSGRVELKPILFNFDRYIQNTEDLEEELKIRNKRPAKIEELLAFGEAYPYLSRRFSIVAHGSVAKFEIVERVAILNYDPPGRSLDLVVTNGGWDEMYTFLVFDIENK